MSINKYNETHILHSSSSAIKKHVAVLLILHAMSVESTCGSVIRVTCLTNIPSHVLINVYLSCFKSVWQ